MRLRTFRGFLIKESLESKFISTDDIEVCTQLIEDVYDINEVGVEYKIINDLKGNMQREPQLRIKFTQDKEDEKVEKVDYEFYDSITPNTEGYIAYVITISFDEFAVESIPNGFKLIYDDYDREIFELDQELESEIKKTIKKLNATFDTKSWLCSRGKLL